MEHLHLSYGSFEHPIKVLYLSLTSTYDGQGFWNFPSRQGWERKYLDGALNYGIFSLLSKSRSSSPYTSAQDVASLLQSWWYFGMLHEILGANVHIADFVTAIDQDCNQYITTENLEAYIKDFYHRLREESPERSREALQRGIRCLNFVHMSLEGLAHRVKTSHQRLSQKVPSRTFISGMRRSRDGRISVASSALDVIVKIGRSVSEIPTRDGDMNDLDGADSKDASLQLLSSEGGMTIGSEYWNQFEVALWHHHGRDLLPDYLEVSICILGQTLRHAIIHIARKLSIMHIDGLQGPGWYVPESILNRLTSNNLCPRAVHRLHTSIQLLGCYYLSTLKFEPEVPVGTHHGDCDTQVCRIDRLKDNMNPKSHTTPDCDCENVPESLVLGQIMTIIEEEGVPLLRMVPSTSSIGFDVDVTRSDNVVYTAFSHVWSDGLGNPEANEIFSCQWRRLQSFADCLKKGRHEDMGEEPMPFWLDIVCIPVCKDRNNTSNQCRRRRMRNKAIQGMRRIYCEADAVLILDNTMLSLESPFRAHEISLRLAYSKWMRRLWTLHEGAMARSAFIRLKNIHVSLHAFINWVEEAVDADTSKDSDKLLSSIGVTEATVPWRSCLHFNISWEAAGYHKMRFAWNEARSRGTKYEEDRYVVIASLLHIDHPEAMYELETPEEKIEFILTRVAEIPPLILFTVAPHIQKNGLRWAPATLNTRIGLVKESPPAIRTPEGLQVTFRGLYLHSQPNWNFRTRYRNQVSEIVQPSSKPEGQCTWIVKIDDGSHDGYLYSATFSIQDHETPKASKQQKLAIILQPRLDSAESLSPAVLVSCNGVKDGIEYTEYIAPIFWAKVTDPTKLLLLRHTIRKGDNQFILGSWRKDGEEPHQWCVG